MEDIFIGSVYIYPEDSTCLDEDQFTILQNELCSLPCQESYLLYGDFNARTDIASDYIFERSDGLLPKLLDDNCYEKTLAYTYLKRNNMLQRHSMDRRPVNRYGAQLIDLCKTNDMFILNGRGDQDCDVDKYTRVDTTGSSVIDYMSYVHPMCTNRLRNSK